MFKILQILDDLCFLGLYLEINLGTVMSLHMRHFGNIVLFVQFKKRENEIPGHFENGQVQLLLWNIFLFDLFYKEKLVLTSRWHLGLRNTCCFISEWKKQRKQSIVPKILCEKTL